MTIKPFKDLRFVKVPSVYSDYETYKEAFPDKGDIDLLKKQYNGKPMTANQLAIAEAFHSGDNEIVSYDSKLQTAIKERVKEMLLQNRINITSDYYDILGQMSMILAHGEPTFDKPIVITTRPGIGKTEILKASIIEKCKHIKDFTALIVTQRVNDAYVLSEEINKALDSTISVVRPSFSLMAKDGICLNKKTSDDYYWGICSTANCSEAACKVKTDRGSYRSYPIVIVANMFFNRMLDSGKIEELMQAPPVYDLETDREYQLLRDELYIDENPSMILTGKLDNADLNECHVHLKSHDFPEDVVQEFKQLLGLAAGEISGVDSYEYTEFPAGIALLSKRFMKHWWTNPHPKLYDLPNIVNAAIEVTSIRARPYSNVSYRIGVAKYRSLTGLPFRTVIFDGTGTRDVTYRSDEFHIIDLDEIRDFSRCTIHHYPQSITKAYLSEKSKSESRIKRLADEALKQIGDRKALFITYKEEYEKDFAKHFEGHQDIEVNHFGNLLGSNDYRNCTAVFIAGLNNWGHLGYYTKYSAVHAKAEERIDLRGDPKKQYKIDDKRVSDFKDALLNIGLYQDIMRSNLRVSSSNEPVDLYIWSEDRTVIDQLADWLPGANKKVEKVPATLVGKRYTYIPPNDQYELIQEFVDSLTENDHSQNASYKMKTLSHHLGYKATKEEYEHIWGDTKGRWYRIHPYYID